MRKILIFVAMLPALSSPAMLAANETGQTIFDNCLKSREWCHGLAVGLTAATHLATAGALLCVPEERVTDIDIGNAVVRYLNAYPEKRRDNYAAVIRGAIHAVWPCPEIGQ